MKNSAGKGGDILYGGAVALGLDGDWNCFKNISNISQNGLSLISSDVSRVCLCNETEHVSCTCLVLSNRTKGDQYCFINSVCVCVCGM